MSISIVQRPERTHKENEDVLCRWNCSRQPYLFFFQRRDAEVINLADDAGFLSMIFSNTVDVSQVVVGASIYVSEYDKAGKITSVIATAPFFIVVTDIAFDPAAATSGGFVNLFTRENYLLNIVIRGTDPNTGKGVDLATAVATPNKRGLIRFDAQSFLNGYMKKRELFNFDIRNKIDKDVFGWFVISYVERWNLSSNAFITDPVKYWFVDAAKSLLSDYGQNLCDYTPTINVDPAPVTNKAKFLTDFERSTFFVGYPFSLSFIYPEEIASSDMTIHEEAFDQSGSSMGDVIDSIDTSQAGGVNRLTLIGQNAAGFYDGVDSVDVWLRQGDILRRRYTVGGYVADGYTESVPPFDIETAQVDLTVRQRVMIVQDCIESPVFLKWRNSKGGWDYWLFGKYQEYSRETSRDGIIFSESDDIEIATRRSKATQMQSKKTFSVGAIVDRVDFEGIQKITSSPCIQMLFDRSKFISEPQRAWIDVLLVPRSLKWASVSPKVEVELVFELPNDYTIQN
jgi:hypothetical protein